MVFFEKKNQKTFAFWVVGLLVGGAGPFCPASVSVVQSPASVPEGFTAYAGATPPTKMPAHAEAAGLEDILFSDGAPEKEGWLAPDTGDGDVVSTWDFAGAKTIWLTCAYASTSVILSAPLPPEITTCTVRYAKDDATPPILQCK